MKIEKKFAFISLLVVSVMLLIAVVPYTTNLSTHRIVAAIGKVQDKQRNLAQLLDYLRDAETGQRGFIITGDGNFLNPYYQAVAEIPFIRKTLDQEPDLSLDEKKAYQQIFHFTDLKLAELDRTIEIRRTQGFEAVKPIVVAGEGKQYMELLRQSIGQEVNYLSIRRDALRADLAVVSQRASYIGAGATLANLIILTLLIFTMMRALKQRQTTATLLKNTAAALSKSMAETSIRNDQMQLSAQMLQALSAISLLEETPSVLSTFCAKLMPDMSGTIFLYRNSRDLLESQASWGKHSVLKEQIEPPDCWALRRGQAHYASGSTDLCCNHYVDGVAPLGGHLCVPLVTQGEVIGLLSLQLLSRLEEGSQSQQELAIGVAEQIALALSNVKLRDTLRRQSIIDPLTGLYNRRYMDETLKRELLRSERKELPLTLIVLDLDHFKQVNDTFGHDAGDAVLKNVAHQVRNSIRDCDVACRFGGEELLVILPECDLHTGIVCAEKIQAAIAALALYHEGRTLGAVTASFGVAAFPSHGHDAARILQAADQALYRAKQAGRNCVIAAEPLRPVAVS